MIPTIGFMIAAYTIARLAQVFVEHSESADRGKRIQLISVLGIIAILINTVILLVNAEAVDRALKTLSQP